MNNIEDDNCNKLAYTIEQFSKATTLGRTMIYAEIKSGNLIAKKIGKRTVITMKDALNYINNLKPINDQL